MSLFRAAAVTAALFILVIPGAALLAAGTPTPTPPLSPQEMAIVDRLAERWQDMSASSSTTANAGVLLLGAGFLLLMVVISLLSVWIVRGGLNPLWAILKREQERADRAEQSETRMRTVSDERDKSANELRTRQAEALERTASILTGIETRQQAEAGRKGAVETINSHTTAALESAKSKLEQAATHIEQAAQTIEDVVTKEVLIEELRPMRAALQEIADSLRKKGDAADSSPRLPILSGDVPHDVAPS